MRPKNGIDPLDLSGRCAIEGGKAPIEDDHRGKDDAEQREPGMSVGRKGVEVS